VILQGDLQKVKNMIEEDPKLLEYKNYNGKSCMHFAAQAGFNDIVNYLLSKGTDVNVKNIGQETPLHYASVLGKNIVVETLLRQGAKINEKNYTGNTPLSYVVQFGNIETLRLLIQNGADVNITDILDYTPLDYAQRLKKEDMVQLLIANGGIASSVPDPEIIHLKENIYRITFPFCERSNITAMKGKDGVVLVDTGCDEKIVEKLKSTLENLGAGKLKYIITTHSHPDHIAGNIIAGNNVPIINYQNLHKMVEDKIISLKYKNSAGSDYQSFDTVYTMSFNDEEIQLIPYPGIHTNEDVIVHFVNAGIVSTGDLLISQSFPSVFQNVPGYLTLLEKMIDIFPKSTIFINGHGKEVSCEDLKNYNRMLVKINDIVLKKLKEGKNAKEIRESEELQGYEEWGVFIPILSINYWIDAITRNYDSENKVQ